LSTKVLVTGQVSFLYVSVIDEEFSLASWHNSLRSKFSGQYALTDAKPGFCLYLKWGLVEFFTSLGTPQATIMEYLF